MKSVDHPIAPCEGIQTSKFHAVDSGFFAVELGFWIPNSMSCISNSKAQDSSNSPSKTFPGFGFHKQSFSRFRNPDSFAWGEKEPESRLTCESLAQIEGWSLQREPPCAKPQREELIGRMGR